MRARPELQSRPQHPRYNFTIPRRIPSCVVASHVASLQTHPKRGVVGDPRDPEHRPRRVCRRKDWRRKIRCRRRSGPRPTPSSRRSTAATPRRWPPSGPPTAAWPTTAARSSRAARRSKTSTRPSSRSIPGRRWKSRSSRSSFPPPTTAIEDGMAQVVAEHAARRRPAATRPFTSARTASGSWPASGNRASRFRRTSPDSQDLGWLIGDWETKRDGHHGPDELPLDRQQELHPARLHRSPRGVASSSGMQIIGWDPQAGQIRSWSFDSSGGHGTSLWSPTPEGLAHRVDGRAGRRHPDVVAGAADPRRRGRQRVRLAIVRSEGRGRGLAGHPRGRARPGLREAMIRLEWPGATISTEVALTLVSTETEW